MRNALISTSVRAHRSTSVHSITYTEDPIVWPWHCHCHDRFVVSLSVKVNSLFRIDHPRNVRAAVTCIAYKQYSFCQYISHCIETTNEFVCGVTTSTNVPAVPERILVLFSHFNVSAVFDFWSRFNGTWDVLTYFQGGNRCGKIIHSLPYLSTHKERRSWEIIFDPVFLSLKTSLHTQRFPNYFLNSACRYAPRWVLLCLKLRM